VHILLSLGEFQSVLQVLRDLRKSDIAALFALACIEKKVLCVDPVSDDSNAEEKGKDREKEKPSSLSNELLKSTGIVDQSQLSASLRVLLENMYHLFICGLYLLFILYLLI
jgi:hypothetical protein